MKQKVIIIFFLFFNCGLSAQCEFINNITGLSVSGETGGDNTQEYVLVLVETGNIVAINSSPDFSGLQGGDYQVYGINYEGTRPTEVTLGSPWASTASIATCFDETAPYNTTVCEEQCNGDDLILTTSGFTTTGSFQQIYILVNMTSNTVVSHNSTGTFNASLLNTNDALEVYALNTDDTTIITAVTDGANWTTIQSTIASGCSDLLGPRSISIIECCTTNTGFIR